MIFVTVGVQLPFDRLVAAMDEWAGAHPGIEVVAQTGLSALACRHMRVFPTLNGDDFQTYVEAAELVVAHAGMGSILTALEIGKPIIVLPRSAELHEHRNDHQAATSNYLMKANLVRVAQNTADLKAMIDQRHLIERRTISAQAQPALISALSDFIHAGGAALQSRHVPAR